VVLGCALLKILLGMFHVSPDVGQAQRFIVVDVQIPREVSPLNAGSMDLPLFLTLFLFRLGVRDFFCRQRSGLKARDGLFTSCHP